MKFDRRSIRLKGWDYSNKGYYFVTICCKDKSELFGKIISGNMILSEDGKVVWKNIYILKDRYPIIIDELMVMPDHVHILIQIVGAIHESPVQNQGIKPRRSLLSLVVGYFKANSSRELKRRIWQRSYYEEIIVNEKKYWAIKRYIRDNPKNWSEDMASY